MPIAVLLAVAFWPEDTEPVLIMREAQVRPDASVPEAAIAKRYRHVQLNPSAIEAVRQGEQVIELELFPGETIRVRLQQSEQTGMQSSEVFGSIEGVPGSMVTLVLPSSRIQVTFKNCQGLDHVVVARPTTIGPLHIQPARIYAEENVTPVGLRRGDSCKIHQCQIHSCARDRVVPSQHVAQHIIKIFRRVHPSCNGKWPVA